VNPHEPHDLSRAEAEALLAAVALHATSDDETSRVEELAAADTELSSELERLRQAAAHLALLEERAPDPRLRATVLATARERREPPTPSSLFREVTADLDALLGSLSGTDWAAPTVFGWTLHDLVAHLAASETLIADLLEGRRDAVMLDDLLAATRANRSRGATPEMLLAEWRAAAAVIRDHPDIQPGAGRRRFTYGYTEVSMTTMVVTRSLELHVHACDVRWALDRPLVFPQPGNYRLMTALGIRAWPLALAVGERSHPGRSARVVLTGAGGGEWIVPLHPGEIPGEPDVTLTADVVDFCFLASDRRRPGDIAVVVEPPEARPLVDDLLAVAATFSNE
jgi:uncharacterized protein (TIGR03083 family)